MLAPKELVKDPLASRSRTEMPQIIVEREILEVQRETEVQMLARLAYAERIRSLLRSAQVIRMDENFKEITRANRSGLHDLRVVVRRTNESVRVLSSGLACTDMGFTAVWHRLTDAISGKWSMLNAR